MNDLIRYNTFGIKFKCTLLQYEKLPKSILKRDYGLEVNFHKDCGIVRSMCGRFAGREKEVEYIQAKCILDHIVDNGFEERKY